jgi:hypothetical protein
MRWGRIDIEWSRDMIKVDSILYVCCALLVSSCSFHSSQLDSVQRIFSNEEDSLKDVAWSARWNRKEFVLYAVNSVDETIFAFNKQVYVHFNGWNITKTTGVLPYTGSVSIEQEGPQTVFYLNGRLLARHQCSEWKEELVANGETTGSGRATTFFQDCESRENYKNRIDVNSNGVITRLEFRIHPEYPSIVMMPLSPEVKTDDQV